MERLVERLGAAAAGVPACPGMVFKTGRQGRRGAVSALSDTLTPKDPFTDEERMEEMLDIRYFSLLTTLLLLRVYDYT